MPPDYWPTFWRNFRDHRAKYGVGLAVLSSSIPPPANAELRSRLAELIRGDQAWKRGLYVDLVDGEVRSPSDIDRALSAEAVRVVGEMIRQGAEHWDGVDLDALFDRGIRHQTAGIDEALAAADAEDIASLLASASGALT